MSSDRDITTTLRALDAADVVAQHTSARAREDLQRILRTDLSVAEPPRRRPSATAPAETVGRPLKTNRPARKVALAAAVLALALGVTVLPALTGGDEAFASWTAVPTALSASQRNESVDSCRDQQQQGAGAGDAHRLGSAQPVIADRRGVWTTVMLSGPGRFTALCVTDSSSHLFAHDMIGSVGTATKDMTPGPRTLIATDLGSGTMSAGAISLAAGTAGSDVVGVVYRSRTHGNVTATVSKGHFALWFPGPELEDLATAGIQVDVTYRDGTAGTARLSL